MWPHRSIVIGHRIVASLAGAKCADAPTGEEILSQKILRDPSRTFGTRDPGEQAVTGVGSADATWPLLSVQSESVSG